MRVQPELLKLIRENKTFLIVSHINPEGDSVGSSIALALGLKKTGKHPYILNRDIVPRILRFLPSANLFNQKIPSKDFDILFIIDCNAIKRTGFEARHLRAKKIVIIDHHIGGYRIQDTRCKMHKFSILNRESCIVHPEISWVDPTASAAGELIYKLLGALRIPLDKEIATNLYTAIFTDTGGFRYSNTTPETLRIASRLLEAGVDTWEITKEVYENFSLNRLRLLTLCLSTMRKQGKLAWAAITQDMYKKTSTTVQDTEDFVNYPRKIEGVEVAVLFREDGKNLYKISFRSKGRVNVADIASAFGGGGHANAAGCEIKGSLRYVKRKAFKAVRDAMVWTRRSIPMEKNGFSN